MSEMLRQELATYYGEKDRLLGEASGKWVLIHGTDVISVFADESDAISEGYRQLGNTPFLVKQVLAVDMPERYVSNIVAI